MATTIELQRSAKLSKEVMASAFRTCLPSRKIDDKEIQLKRQNRIYFQINGVGHEALNVACALQMRPGYDWFYPYYRDRALCLELGTHAARDVPAGRRLQGRSQSGGAPDALALGVQALHIVSRSSPTGTQVLQAVGAAEASLYFARVREAAELASSFHQDEVVYVSLGDGATSEGEFWEAMNGAALIKRRCSSWSKTTATPSRCRWRCRRPAASISQLWCGISPTCLRRKCDGTDFLAAYEACGPRARTLPRRRQGPALVHAHVIRPYSHSLSDDERLYKSEASAPPGGPPATRCRASANVCWSEGVAERDRN